MPPVTRDVISPRGAVRLAQADTTDSLAAQLAGITTDTGAFAPGHKDFAHYNVPGLCLAAAENYSALTHHSLAAQLFADTLDRDTVGLGATANFVKPCGGKFTVNNAPINERWFLFKLAFFEQNDTLAQAVIPALEHSEVTDDYDVGHLWGDAFLELYYHGRLAAAERVMNRVRDAGPEYLKEFHTLRDIWRRSLIRDRSDTAAQRKDAEWWIANGKLRQDPPRDYPNMIRAYWDLMKLAVMEDTTQLPALAGRAQRDLGQFSVAQQGEHIQCALQRKLCGNWETFSADTVISRLAPDWYTIPKYNRTPAPPLTADSWALPQGASPADSVIPVKGKINLICQAADIVSDDPTWLMSQYESGQKGNSWRQGAMIHEWLARYGRDQLAITLVHSEEDGFEMIGHQNGLYYLYDSVPDRARDVWRWYDQVYHENPVPVAVQYDKTTQWLPQPDGRRFKIDKTPFNTYGRAIYPYKQTIQDVYARTMTGVELRGGEVTGYCALVGRKGELIDVKAEGIMEWNDILAWYLTGLGKLRQ